MPHGSAYVVETWKNGKAAGTSPLQQQVRALFEGLSVQPEHVLAGNLVPFRSPSWKELKNPKSSLEFGELLWTDLLKRARPRLVIGMGQDVLRSLSRILAAKNHLKISMSWGNVCATKVSFPDGTLIVLPHLSRFKIVTRPKSSHALKELFKDRWSER